ncbi:MAG: endonuclease Q family protein [Candidatus Ranarchaeia archaeon]
MNKIFLDYHIHSKYSRGTSPSITPERLGYVSGVKGIDIVGTGDILHPEWFEEVRNKLVECSEGIYKLKNEDKSNKISSRFILTTEIESNFSIEQEIIKKGKTEQEVKSKRIHNVLLFPNLEIIEQVSETLSKFGDLSVNGRPILHLSCRELIEEVKNISDKIEVISAHIWTPHFSSLGARGFTSLKECYDGKEKDLLALETGLSADPEMCWRVEELDNFPLISSSDAHSAQPLRLGREATVFNLSQDENLDSISYNWITGSIRNNGKDGRLFGTIETEPAYGKYHLTGHRSDRAYRRKGITKNHGKDIIIEPKQAISQNNKCPICGNKLTIGVVQQIERLSNREIGYKPKRPLWFLKLVPFIEILQWSMGLKTNTSKSLFENYYKIIDKFNNEYELILNTPINQIENQVGKGVSKIIERLRTGSLVTKPGFDGVYGVTDFNKMQR